MEPGRLRHPGTKILPQSRCACALGAGCGTGPTALAVAAHRRQGGARSAGRERPPRRRDERPPGLRPNGRDLDLLGLERRLFRQRERCSRLLRRDPADARPANRRAELAAMVQHRAPLGLRHRRPGAGPLSRRSRERQIAGLGQCLRAPAAACLLHPVGRRRSRQSRRDHGPLGARSAAVQIRVRLRLEFLENCAARARRCPAAVVPRA